MNKLVDAYIEQYQNGLITLGELADKLHEYAYLPRELIETGSESEIKKYIKKNIG